MCLMERMDTSKLNKQYGLLESGKTYEVINTFVDFDSIRRYQGEKWKFVGSSFLPYENGLSLFFKVNGKLEHIRLQTIPEQQLEISENLEHYFSPIKAWWQFWK